MIELTAPAKINLTLEVLGRREDGYHAIATIMHTLSLHDTLLLTPYNVHPSLLGKRIVLEVEGFAVPTDERNLVWRALELVEAAERTRFLASLGMTTKQENAPKTSGWCVRLIKRIPPEAGLGGGSSDAAAIVRYFLHGSPLLRGNLQEGDPDKIALQLGSDVPFFLNGACARVEGRGEQVKPLPSLPSFWWVLAKPMEIGISTAWAYAQLKRSLLKSADQTYFKEEPAGGGSNPTDRLEQSILRCDIHTPEALAPLLHNDFEAAVLPAFEPLQRLRAHMETMGALRVLLCGSGAAQAALCTSQTEAEQMATALCAEGYWAIATQLGL